MVIDFYFAPSIFIVEGTLSTSVDSPNHISKVIHAQIEARALSPEATIKIGLILLGVIWRIPDGLSILLLRVTAPHHVEWLFAGQKVVRLIFQHLGVANINTYENQGSNIRMRIQTYQFDNIDIICACYRGDEPLPRMASPFRHRHQ